MQRLKITPQGAKELALEGEIDLMTVGELASAVPGGDGHVTLDLTAVTFMDSSGIAFIVDACREHPDRRLILRGVQGPVMRVLEITDLPRLLPNLEIQLAE